jgi:nucleoside-diphosphate-sugar epimerase
MPWNQLPAPVRAVSKVAPVLKPVVPDPGFPLQLVHHDDVAEAIALAATAPAPPGAYNIAGDGLVTISDVARALGGRPLRVPAAAASAASAALSRVPFVPSMLEWLHVARTSVVMDTSKARTQLGWQPVHSAGETLQALAGAV